MPHHSREAFQLSRRQFLQTAAGFGISGLSIPLAKASSGFSRLPIPDLLDTTDTMRTTLERIQGLHDFGTGGKSATFAINRSYLAPVVRVRDGTSFAVDVYNTLDEPVALPLLYG